MGPACGGAARKRQPLLKQAWRLSWRLSWILHHHHGYYRFSVRQKPWLRKQSAHAATLEQGPNTLTNLPAGPYAEHNRGCKAQGCQRVARKRTTLSLPTSPTMALPNLPTAWAGAKSSKLKGVRKQDPQTSVLTGGVHCNPSPTHRQPRVPGKREQGTRASSNAPHTADKGRLQRKKAAPASVQGCTRANVH